MIDTIAKPLDLLSERIDRWCQHVAVWVYNFRFVALLYRAEQARQILRKLEEQHRNLQRENASLQALTDEIQAQAAGFCR